MRCKDYVRWHEYSETEWLIDLFRVISNLSAVAHYDEDPEKECGITICRSTFLIIVSNVDTYSICSAPGTLNSEFEKRRQRGKKPSLIFKCFTFSVSIYF